MRSLRNTTRRLFGMLMLIFAAVTLVPASASASAAGTPGSGLGVPQFGIRIYDVPADEAHNPRALLYIIDYVPSGTAIHRRILIMNEEPVKAHFTVYPDAAMITSGSFMGDAGETRSELTSWVTIARHSLNLAPHARFLDMVTIRVPRGATRGEHYGVIWFQQIAHARTHSGVRIKQITRVGIRIYLEVGRGGAPPTKFTCTSLTGYLSSRGRPLLIAHVDNTGGRAVDLGGKARLAQGPGGETAGPFPDQRVVTLAPGQSGNVTFAPPKGLSTGPWLATVSLVSGFTTDTAAATIQFTNHPAAPPLLTRLPVVLSGCGVLVALLLIAVVRTRRPRRPSRVHA
jgi:hypothetical protein